VLARRCCNDSRKIRVYRHGELNAGLLLFDIQDAIVVVLRPHSDYIAASLPGEE